MSQRSSSSTTPRWGSIQDAAAERHVSTKTIRRLIASGHIYAERLGPRLIQVDLDSIQGTPLQFRNAS